MYRDAYAILKIAIKQKYTFYEIVTKLTENMQFKTGYLGMYQYNKSGDIQPYYATFTNAISGLFENIDSTWMERQITGETKVSVSYINNCGWSISFGNTDKGRHFRIKDLIELEKKWNNDWNISKNNMLIKF